MKKLIIVGAIIVLVTFGAFFYRVSPNPTSGNNDALTFATTTETPQNTNQSARNEIGTDGEVGWKTYIDAGNGFRIKYPEQYLVTATFPSFYHITNGWLQGAFATTSKQTTQKALARILVNEKKSAPGEEQYYYDAELRIGTSKDVSDVANCLVSTSSASSSIVYIHDIEFKVFPQTQAGMNQSADIISYRTIHNGTCFAVESIQTLGGTNIEVEKLKAPMLLNQDKENIKSIISTFLFTASSTTL